MATRQRRGKAGTVPPASARKSLWPRKASPKLLVASSCHTGRWKHLGCECDIADTRPHALQEQTATVRTGCKSGSRAKRPGALDLASFGTPSCTGCLDGASECPVQGSLNWRRPERDLLRTHLCWNPAERSVLVGDRLRSGRSTPAAWRDLECKSAVLPETALSTPVCESAAAGGVPKGCVSPRALPIPSPPTPSAHTPSFTDPRKDPPHGEGVEGEGERQGREVRVEGTEMREEQGSVGHGATPRPRATCLPSAQALSSGSGQGNSPMADSKDDCKLLAISRAAMAPTLLARSWRQGSARVRLPSQTQANAEVERRDLCLSSLPRPDEVALDCCGRRVGRWVWLVVWVSTQGAVGWCGWVGGRANGSARGCVEARCLLLVRPRPAPLACKWKAVSVLAPHWT